MHCHRNPVSLGGVMGKAGNDKTGETGHGGTPGKGGWIDLWHEISALSP